MDMLKELAEILRFNYKIHLVGDGVYGVPEANGTWTGMVGELIARVSGLAAPFNSAPLGFGAAKPPVLREALRDDEDGWGFSPFGRFGAEDFH